MTFVCGVEIAGITFLVNPLTFLIEYILKAFFLKVFDEFFVKKRKNVNIFYEFGNFLEFKALKINHFFPIFFYIETLIGDSGRYPQERDAYESQRAYRQSGAVESGACTHHHPLLVVAIYRL